MTNLPKLLGIDGKQKMSKSLGNHIPLTVFGNDKATAQAAREGASPTRSACTREDPGNPDDCPTIGQMHKAISSPEDNAWVREGCTTAGIGCVDCKGKLADNMNAHFASVRRAPRRAARESGTRRGSAREGAAKARDARAAHDGRGPQEARPVASPAVRAPDGWDRSTASRSARAARRSPRSRARSPRWRSPRPSRVAAVASTQPGPRSRCARCCRRRRPAIAIRCSRCCRPRRAAGSRSRPSARPISSVPRRATRPKDLLSIGSSDGVAAPTDITVLEERGDRASGRGRLAGGPRGSSCADRGPLAHRSAAVRKSVAPALTGLDGRPPPSVPPT